MCYGDGEFAFPPLHIMEETPTLRLERCDPAKRMLRFYALQVTPNLFGEWCLLRTWGRIGRQGQMRTEWFETKEEAEDALRLLETAKRKREKITPPK